MYIAKCCRLRSKKPVDRPRIRRPALACQQLRLQNLPGRLHKPNDGQGIYGQATMRYGYMDTYTYPNTLSYVYQFRAVRCQERKHK